MVYIGDNMKNKVISFTKKDVKKYLDECIIFWRDTRNKDYDSFAPIYVDAYQSIRMSLFDAKLDENDK